MQNSGSFSWRREGGGEGGWEEEEGREGGGEGGGEEGRRGGRDGGTTLKHPVGRLQSVRWSHAHWLFTIRPKD